MPLPTITKLKEYLRIETAAEDAVLTDLLVQATPWAQSLIGIPITASERTFYNVRPVFVGEGVGYSLSLGVYPVAAAPAPVVTDARATVVTASNYRVDPALGWMIPITTYSFADDSHTVIATVGLSAHPRYATEIEPRVNALILGLASILYHQRNPNAASESAGGGVSVSYGKEEIPPQLMSLVRGLRPVRL